MIYFEKSEIFCDDDKKVNNKQIEFAYINTYIDFISCIKKARHPHGQRAQYK